MNRREFLWATGGAAAVGSCSSLTAVSGGAQMAEARASSATMPPWQSGYLDIHHINTGRGNATLVVMPDGSSLLIDSGASGTRGPTMNTARPDGSRRPGQWIASYVERQLRAVHGGSGKAGLDFALLTHLHGDHIGDVSPESPESSKGGYKLTGISDVAHVIPIAKMIDRGYPRYDYPAAVKDVTGLNYIAFVQSAAQRGTVVDQVRVGSVSQIGLVRTPGRYPEFAARIVAGNGRVWDGKGETSLSQFPAQGNASVSEVPSENSCSIALRLKYGNFTYFTGGDLNCDTNYGRDLWQDVETPAAKVAGPVSVSTCNHHGYFDADGPEFVRLMRPRVWILQSWHASHPAMPVLANLYSSVLYPGPRDVFCLGLHPAAALSCARFSDSFKSSQGHVLVRVAPGGAEYAVLVLEDGHESDAVKARFGPYPSQV